MAQPGRPEAQTADPHAQYREQEGEARLARVGLWADAAPVAPWLWRKRVQQAAG